MTTGEKLRKLKDFLLSDYSLTASEANALLAFKGHECVFLNEKIRSNNLSDGDIELINSLHLALQKLPCTSHKVIYRHLKFTNGTYSKAEEFFLSNVSKVIQFPDFLSCTLLENFTGTKSNYNFSIKILTSTNSFARDIYSIWVKYGLNDAEKKIAYTKKSCFIVEGVYPDEDIKLVLRESLNLHPHKSVPNFI